MTVIEFRNPSTWQIGVVEVLEADVDGLADWFRDRLGRSAAFFLKELLTGSVPFWFVAA
ncbi:hypothetical protein [Pinirhizobacter soli]|uniref:hypothetical protein n=1 Tax=Pinirhizobacter soli TaxID=2786953 RepID=UPI00202A8D41|nr:hypothetical protein [Pinirhizobacter soli]